MLDVPHAKSSHYPRHNCTFFFFFLYVCTMRKRKFRTSDICFMRCGFQQIEPLLENYTNITLISKKENPYIVNQFHVISHCNVVLRWALKSYCALEHITYHHLKTWNIFIVIKIFKIFSGYHLLKQRHPKLIGK